MILNYQDIKSRLNSEIDECHKKLDEHPVHYFIYNTCIGILERALKKLDDAVYFNRQIESSYYRENPDAPIENPDEYLSQEDLDKAMDAIYEVRDIERSKISENNTIAIVAACLVVGIAIGIGIGRKLRRRSE